MNFKHLSIVFTILFLLISAFGYSQTLTLYTIPSVKKLNFKSPHHLLVSIGRNVLSKQKNEYPLRPIGHVIVELASKDKDTILTGIVADNKIVLYKPVLAEKQGLGVLFTIMKGHLEKKTMLRNEINERCKSGQIAFISYQINDSSYQFLKNYIDSFQLLGYHKMYNGENKPRHGKGSGCSAFGVSFLELIHAIDTSYDKEWKIDIPIQNRLIGGRLTENRVSLWTVFFSFKWAKDKTPHTHIVLYDPSLMYNWIQSAYSDKYSNFLKTTNYNANGIVIKCTKTCKPQYPMFPIIDIK